MPALAHLKELTHSLETHELAQREVAATVLGALLHVQVTRPVLFGEVVRDLQLARLSS